MTNCLNKRPPSKVHFTVMIFYDKKKIIQHKGMCKIEIKISVHNLVHCFKDLVVWIAKMANILHFVCKKVKCNVT